MFRCICNTIVAFFAMLLGFAVSVSRHVVEQRLGAVPHAVKGFPSLLNTYRADSHSWRRRNHHLFLRVLYEVNVYDLSAILVQIFERMLCS